MPVSAKIPDFLFAELDLTHGMAEYPLLFSGIKGKYQIFKSLVFVCPVKDLRFLLHDLAQRHGCLVRTIGRRRKNLIDTVNSQPSCDGFRLPLP
jgi:hypothetical protein